MQYICLKKTEISIFCEKAKKNKLFLKSLLTFKNHCAIITTFAGVAESADAHVWGACIFDVRVQVPFPAPIKKADHVGPVFFIGRKKGQTSGKPSVFKLKTIINRFLNAWHFPHHKETIILIRKISVLWFFYCKNMDILPFFIGFTAKI